MSREHIAEGDLAAMRQDQFVAAALAKHARAAGAMSCRRGVCLNCEAKILPSELWCDTSCRQDYEAREQIARRKGGR